MGNEMNEPWEDAGDGWIQDASGKYVVDYAGCGSHSAMWRSEDHFKLAVAAPELLAALRAIKVLAPPGTMMRFDAEQAIAKATGQPHD